jgi:hypothetical protein
MSNYFSNVNFTYLSQYDNELTNNRYSVTLSINKDLHTIQQQLIRNMPLTIKKPIWCNPNTPYVSNGYTIAIKEEEDNNVKIMFHNPRLTSQSLTFIYNVIINIMEEFKFKNYEFEIVDYVTNITISSNEEYIKSLLHEEEDEDIIRLEMMLRRKEFLEKRKQKK